MADKFTREDKYRIWQCIECGHNHYFHRKDYKQGGLNCEDCGGVVDIAGYTNQKPLPLRGDYPDLEKEAKLSGELTYKLSVDAADALKGLKAIQREARKASAALKELEEQQKALDPELFERHYLCTWVEEEKDVINQEKADAAYEEYLEEEERKRRANEEF